MLQLGFFGSGVMAEAILRGLITKEIVKPSDVWASDM
jgi:pyrroline-5-carboxylate reductase